MSGQNSNGGTREKLQFEVVGWKGDMEINSGCRGSFLGPASVFESLQSRRTVCGETLRTAAVSSTLRPAKKRSSTTWALRASTLASDCTAHPFHERGVAFRGDDHSFIQGYLVAAPPLSCAFSQSVIDQHPPHQSLRRQREKWAAILPSNAMHVHQPQESLVDEGGGLQSVVVAFASHVASGDSLQFLVHDGDQLVECGRSPALQRATRR